MRVGIGLPNAVPGAAGRDLAEWARRAEGYGFSTLATIDRLAYPSHESLVALAAAAAVTERIGLLTDILLAPTRSAVLLAKQAATLDQLSQGRFTLGVAVGSRADDYELVGQPFQRRGRTLDEMLAVMHAAWRGEQRVTPTPVNGERVPVLIGGTSDAALARVVRWGEGWTAGGGGPERAGSFFKRVRAAWETAGRAGEPRLVALSYYALGDDIAPGKAFMRDYYAYIGPFVEQMAAGLPGTPQALRDSVNRFAAIGCDELIFVPTIADVGQVDLLAEAVL